MGLWPGDDFYSYRYDYAEEYAFILRELWEHGRLTHHGRFDLDDCEVLPTPPYGVKLISAGQSARGQEFCARYADYHFSAVGEPKAVAAMNRRTHELAAAQGRSVTSLNLATIVLADTDADARRKVELYTEGADLEAIGFMTGQYSRDTNTDGSSAAVVAGHSGERPSPFYGGAQPIVGSAATVAAQLDEMAAIEGTGGIMLVFDDFVEGVARFGAEVMPLLSTPSDGNLPIAKTDGAGTFGP